MKHLIPLTALSYLLAVCLLVSCKDPYPTSLKKIIQDTSAFGDPKPLDTLDQNENEFMSCTVRDMQWTPGSAESILLEPTDWVFPGNVLEAKSLQDGAYTTIAGDRKSINLVIDGQIFNKMSIEVPNPGQKSIKDSIKSMLISGKIGSQPADVNISAKEVYSEEHLKLLVRSKYSGGFGSLAAGFDFSNANISSRYLLDVTQIYYTINMETPQSGFFNKRPEKITDSSIAPVYISSIKYGRRVLISVETQQADQKTEADFKARFNAVASSGSLDVNIFSDKFFTDKSVKVMVKGGNSDNAYKVFKAVSTKQELYDILAKDAQWSLDNLGVPLAYQLRNTSDNTNFYISQTGTFKARMCTVKSQNDTIVNVNPIERLCAWHVGGNDRNFGDNPDVDFSIKLEPDKNIIWCKIQGFMKEPGGDGTAGSIIVSRKIIELPEDYTIIQISTPRDLVQPTVRLGNKGQTPFQFPDAQRYPVSLVTVIGDSDGNNNDDLFPGACGDDIHAQIRSIIFHPISIKYTRRNKK
jgi:hypothetical protein